MLLDICVIVENNGTKDDYKTNIHIFFSPPSQKEDVDDWQPLFVFNIMLSKGSLEAQMRINQQNCGTMHRSETYDSIRNILLRN